MLKIEINVKDGKSTLEITGSSTTKDILSAIKTLDVAKKTFKDSLKESAIESFSKILGKENAERLISDERVEKAIDNCLKKSKFEKNDGAEGKRNG